MEPDGGSKPGAGIGCFTFVTALTSTEGPANRTRTMLMYVMVGLFGAFLLASYMLTYRRILKSIVTLQAGAAVIGSGNLDFAIEEKRNDEIGDLSRAFNQMTINLKAVTASKADLEREVTQRKRAEEKLRKSRDELEIRVQERTTELANAYKELKEQSRILESFFKYTVTPLVFLDRDFNFIRVNEAYAKACQREVSEFPGHNHFEFYPSDAKKIFEQVVETRKSYQAIARPFTFPDHPEWGTTYWDWNLTPILDDAGEVESLVLSLEDVTKRKQAETQLKAASLYARSLIEASLDPLVTINRDGKIMDVNRATELVTGVLREQLIGSDFSNYFTEPKGPRDPSKCSKQALSGIILLPSGIQQVW